VSAMAAQQAMAVQQPPLSCHGAGWRMPAGGGHRQGAGPLGPRRAPQACSAHARRLPARPAGVRRARTGERLAATPPARMDQQEHGSQRALGGACRLVVACLVCMCCTCGALVGTASPQESPRAGRCLQGGAGLGPRGKGKGSGWRAGNTSDLRSALFAPPPPAWSPLRGCGLTGPCGACGVHCCQVLYRRNLEEAVARECAELADELGVTLTAYCDERILAAALDEHTERLLFYKEPTPEAVGPLAQQVAGLMVRGCAPLGGGQQSWAAEGAGMRACASSSSAFGPFCAPSGHIAHAKRCQPPPAGDWILVSM
jgi:hypothetical protein